MTSWGGGGELKVAKICIRSSELIGPAAVMQPRFQLIWSFQGGEGMGRPGGPGKLGVLAIFDPAGREETKRRLLRLVSFQPHLIAEATGGRSCRLGGGGGR